MKTTLHLKINPRDPDLSKVREAARGAREGKLVAFPTETVYGVGGPMSIAGTAEKLRSLKQRDPSKPFSYHIGDWEMLEFLRVQRTPAFRYLARRFWPGPVTLIGLDQEGTKIGIRFPANRIAVALINAVGEPFIATSANLSGKDSGRTPEEVARTFEGQIDFLVDGGPAEYGEDSTVVDVSDPAGPVVLRRGAEIQKVEEAVGKIQSGKFPRKMILFVCTGNSCRSPMAEGWFRHELAKAGLEEEIEAHSCGIGARVGASATPEAIYVMKNRDIDISNHLSRPCSRSDVIEADLIVAMSPQHAAFITGILRGTKDKIVVLNIVDPIGMSMTVYEDVLQTLEQKLKEMWRQLVA